MRVGRRSHLVVKMRLVVDACMTLDFERRVVDAEVLGQHLFEFVGAHLRVVQAERLPQHHMS